MKLHTSSSTLVALSALLPLAAADFNIYYTEFTGEPGSVKQQGYMLFNDDPTDCTPINTSPFIPWKEDFTGEKFAVTCDEVMDGVTMMCGEMASLSLPLSFLCGAAIRPDS
jgi:hypothetical protein